LNSKYHNSDFDIDKMFTKIGIRIPEQKGFDEQIKKELYDFLKNEWNRLRIRDAIEENTPYRLLRMQKIEMHRNTS